MRIPVRLVSDTVRFLAVRRVHYRARYRLTLIPYDQPLGVIDVGPHACVALRSGFWLCGVGDTAGACESVINFEKTHPI